jgi:UDP-glucose 4-epimerase
VDPNVNAWTLIANDLCRQAATTKRIILKSSGLAWRNFIAMADTVSALQHVLTMPRALMSDGLFHLGGPASLRIWDLAQLIADHADKLFGQSTKTERAPPDQHVYPVLEWRINKLVSTGWATTTTLGDEIERTLRLCREWHSVPGVTLAQ